MSSSSESRSSTPATIPELSFPEHLPVCARRDDIAAALMAHQVLIVCGETGSGKTTQLPKIALAAGRGGGIPKNSAQDKTPSMIGMTQPRRIAAKTVAHRIAEETKSELGGLVGWQVRFTDQVSASTQIKVMTDGILLAATQSDPMFKAYDTLILDEAHERSLNIDFLLGYLKTLLPKRPDLKLIISSATLEADRFSAYFNGAPVIEVSGRTYPVEMRYRPCLLPSGAGGERKQGSAAKSPPSPLTSSPDGEGNELALLHAVDELAAEGPGDILVFLPGEREIRDAMEDLRKHHPPHTEILPLFARLSVAEQERVFAPHTGRRIVLATNVAETSLTVPGIRYVVDAGLARVKRYSLRNKIEQLKIEKISQAAANQRAGRCGRVAEGICIRLYDEADFQSRPPYTTPEILRSSLAGVILRMKSLHLPEIDVFPFLDAPEGKRVRDGQQLLLELGALDESHRLTQIGRQLAHLPLDPRIGRMLIAAREKGVLSETLVIAAFLSVQDPRDRPMESQQAADEKHRRFTDVNSDFISILNLWRHAESLYAHRKSHKKLRETLKKEFISPNRLREWRDVYKQLEIQVKELGWPVSPTIAPVEGESVTPVAYASLHQALLPGLLGNMGLLMEDGVYLGARDMKFLPFPGSGVKKKPKWCMAAEIVETKRVYARTLAKIESEWVEHAARHLLKISYSDPHWSKKPAHVSAAMRATVYGLPVVNGRKVHYGPIDPVLSRTLFIRGALVQGDWDCRAPFFKHNQQLQQEVDDLAHRTRNARLEVDEEAVFRFFDDQIPADITNGAAFEKWRIQVEKSDPKRFFLSREALMGQQTASQAHDFPPQLTHHTTRFTLSYRFDPGASDDGVTLHVPLAALNQVPVIRCDWLVPGLLEEKITALLKSLPQSVRRNFVPVPDYARAAAEMLDQSVDDPTSPLSEALGHFLFKRTGHRIPRDAWRPEALPVHLHMNFRILEENGKILSEGRNLSDLRVQLGGKASEAMARAIASAPVQGQQSDQPPRQQAGLQARSQAGAQVNLPASSYERDTITQWDFGSLPESARLSVATKAGHLSAYPALQIHGAGVRLSLFDSLHAAQTSHPVGVARLLWLTFPDLLKQTERDLTQRLKPACLQYGLLFKGEHCANLIRETGIAAALYLLSSLAIPRNAEQFATTQKHLRPLLPKTVNEMAQHVLETISTAQHLQQALTKAPANAKTAVNDLQAQLDDLVFPGFLLRHPAAQLPHLPRYLKGMSLRLAKLAHHLPRDISNMNDMTKLEAAFRKRCQHAADEPNAELEQFRWLLQELRVSLFAQELKTPMPVSVKRLEKRWQEICDG